VLNAKSIAESSAAETSHAKVAVTGVPSAFGRYPAAVKAGGLIFTSGQRGPAAEGTFEDMPREGRGKAQGFGAADQDEETVAVSSWRAHAALEATLAAAGSATDQILRQHVWQRDKRFFPVYEAIRRHWQPTPAPSSGLGVADLGDADQAWLGLDAIAVAADAPAPFGPRSVVAAVDHRALPSASHYSQAVRTGPLIFTAGHIPIKTSEPGKPVVKAYEDVPEEGRQLATGRSHPDSRDGPIAAQTWFVYKELEKLLAHAGCTLEDTVLSTVYLADLRDLAVFHRVHRQFFPNGGPALCVSAFNEVGHRGCSIEIELTVLDPKSDMKREAVAWPVRAPLDAPAAVRCGDFVFLSGMAAFDDTGRVRAPAGSETGSDAELAAQTRLTFQRLAETLKAAGGGLADLTKLTVYLRTNEEFDTFEQVAGEVLPAASLPALEVVPITGPGPVQAARIQLEGIAYIRNA